MIRRASFRLNTNPAREVRRDLKETLSYKSKRRNSDEDESDNADIKQHLYCANSSQDD